jgi:hypothetical protein
MEMGSNNLSALEKDDIEEQLISELLMLPMVS